MTARPWLPLILLLVLAFAAAGIGAAATQTSVHTWYPSLNKPSWNPPSALFAPVWTLLYILMAVATWRVWKIGSAKTARRTVALYSAQLMLNTLWSVLFFGLRRPDAALVDVLTLLAVIGFILVRYWRMDRIAAVLWLPYVAWVTYASALNFSIWQMNPN